MSGNDPQIPEFLQIDEEQQRLIRETARRLQPDFTGVFNLETIERYLIDSQARLDSNATVSRWMPLLVERFTRDRLRALSRLELGDGGRPAVLFLCVHNAGRSLMAAGWLRHLAGDSVEVFSGGTHPGTAPNANAVAAMAEVGIDISQEFPKPWTDEIARAADVIVSMGCGDACPIHPGKRYEDWDLADPSDQPNEVVRQIRDEIGTRVRALVATLGSPSVSPTVTQR